MKYGWVVVDVSLAVLAEECEITAAVTGATMVGIILSNPS